MTSSLSGDGPFSYHIRLIVSAGTLYDTILENINNAEMYGTWEELAKRIVDEISSEMTNTKEDN